MKRQIVTRRLSGVLILFAACSLRAQSINLSVSPTQVKPNTTATVTLTYADSAPSAGLAGLQWQLVLPPGLTAAPAVPGAAAIAAQKIVTCGILVCLLIGDGMPPNATPMASGVLATIPVMVASPPNGPLNIVLTGVLGTTGPGLAVNLTSYATVTVCRWNLLKLKLIC